MLRQCKTHGLTTFSIRGDGRYKCRKCAVVAVSKRRRKVKAMAVRYKGGNCVICGYSRSIEGLSFHHLNPLIKEIDLSNGRTIGWESIKKELDKCILVCLTCHAEIHAGRHPQYLQ